MDYRYGSHTVYKIPLSNVGYWGRHFLASGYFCATVGEMKEEIIKNYLVQCFEPNNHLL